MKAILFDLDGVLVDAADWHYKALNMALKECGYTPISRSSHDTVYNGLPTREKLNMLNIRHEDIAKIKLLKIKYTEEIIIKECKEDYKKIEMLERLFSAYKLACCSNSTRKSILLMLNQSKIEQYFSVIVGNDDITKNKPDPEVYLTGMKDLEVDPKDCLIVEDSHYGIEAGMKTRAIVIASKYKNINSSLFERLGLI